MSDRRRTRTPARSPGSLTAEPVSASTRRWTLDEVRALGATTDLLIAAEIIGLSRNSAYRLARRDEFPVPVIRTGARYRVPVAGLLALLQPPLPAVAQADAVGAARVRPASRVPPATT